METVFINFILFFIPCKKLKVLEPYDINIKMSSQWPHKELVPMSLLWWAGYDGSYRKVIAMRDGSILEYANFQNGWLRPGPITFASYDAWVNDLSAGKTTVYPPYNLETEISNRLEAVPQESSDYTKVSLIHTLFDIDTRVYTSPSPFDMVSMATELVRTTTDECNGASRASPGERYHLNRILRSRIALKNMRIHALNSVERSKRHLPQFTIYTGAGKKLIGTKGGVEYPIAIWSGRILFNGALANTFDEHGLDTYDDGAPRVTLLYEGKRTLV